MAVNRHPPGRRHFSPEDTQTVVIELNAIAVGGNARRVGGAVVEDVGWMLLARAGLSLRGPGCAGQRRDDKQRPERARHDAIVAARYHAGNGPYPDPARP